MDVRGWSDRYGTGGPILDVKGIPDVNGNGWPEIIGGSQDNNLYAIDGSTMEKIWNKYLGLDVISVSFIEDISGDTRPEVVVGCESGYLAVIDGVNASIIWDYSSSYGDVYRVKVIQDLDGDTISEVLAGAGRTLYCINGFNGDLLWATTPYYGAADFTEIPDLTGDGKVEVAHFMGAIRILNGTTGVAIEHRSMDQYHDYRLLVKCVPDVSGDGFSDLVLYTYGFSEWIYVLSGISLETIWSQSYGSSNKLWDINYIADITTDGRPEVLIGFDNQLECRDGMNGSLLWSKTLSHGNPDFTYTQRIAVSESDLVVGCEDGMIYNLYPENGSLVNGQYSLIGGAVNSIEFIDDATGDSIHDLAVAGRDHYIYIIDFGAMSSDTTPPEIGAPTQDPPRTDVNDNHNVTVSVGVTDVGSSVSEVILSYSVNDGITWQNITMIGQGENYNGTIQGYPKDIIVRYRIIAYDVLRNHIIKEMPYFNYRVIPEFTSVIFLLLFLLSTLLAAISYRRKSKVCTH